MWTQRRRLGGAAAVGAAAAILAVCTAGGPLYISSAASESVQRQLDDGRASGVARYALCAPHEIRQFDFEVVLLAVYNLLLLRGA